jgi:uncharacterized membrane-anchored protein YjiN (DUF445 family)
MKKVVKLKESDLQRIVKRTIKEQDNDYYDEEFYGQMEDEARKLNDERSNVLFNHIYECLLNLDITGLYRDTQREFLNKYNDVDWTEDIDWGLTVDILKSPIPKKGFNIKDLAFHLLDEIKHRMDVQSELDDPDSLTNYDL